MQRIDDRIVRKQIYIVTSNRLKQKFKSQQYFILIPECRFFAKYKILKTS